MFNVSTEVVACCVWLSHDWCHMKLLPSQHTFCVYRATMRQFTVSSGSKSHVGCITKRVENKSAFFRVRHSTHQGWPSWTRMMWTVTVKGLITSVSFRAQHMLALSKLDTNDVDSDSERVKNECIFQG